MKVRAPPAQVREKPSSFHESPFYHKSGGYDPIPATTVKCTDGEAEI
ncbi:MAG: hypothetical protein IKO57_11035 [Treponema sp.]|nr:hypothetical protein [Treponema sp.]